MSAPKAPPDYSLQVEQMRQAEAQRIREAEALKEKQRKEELLGLRGSAEAGGRASAQNYFSGKGLDPTQYATDIDSIISSTLAGISPDDPNPGSYFNNIGETVFGKAQENARSKAMRELDKIFTPNFETTRIPWTLDDPYLSSIEAESRSEADNIIRNMLNRGVITQTGANAAFADLDKQAPGARSRLNEIGTTTLAGGHGQLKDIANKGRQTASTLDLGTAFDPYSFGKQSDDAFNTFIATLGDTIRGKAPADLFSTAGIGSVAGAGQGAQNTKFDPNALAGGMADEEDDEDDNNPASVF